ncbi:MAG: PorT family protein [Saprospiraceae bacterium]|jgi:hypothetical protein|nr:PorT family protein [Saprospiraceae bacterium]
MFHLSRQQIIFAILILVSTSIFAQRGNTNYLDFKSKPYFFGITLGFNSSDYRVFKSKSFLSNDTIRVVEPERGPGFNLGIITNLKLGEYFDIRFLPTLSFAERNLTYFSNTGSFNERKVESVFVDMPFHVRYKSAPFNDMRVFVIGGVKYTFDVASDSRTRQAKDLVKISPSDFSYEYGFGMQFYFPYFIFSPEFKVSQGINNILIYDKRIDQSNVLEKVMSRVFTISLNFEG